MKHQQVSMALSRSDDLLQRDGSGEVRVPSEFRTLKEARIAGFRELNQGEYGEGAIAIKGHSLYLTSNIKSGYSKNSWRIKGFRITKGEVPFDFKYSYMAKEHHGVYREDQVEQKGLKTVRPPVNLGVDRKTIIECIRAVNHAAKRRRDAAGTYYSCGEFGFASYSSERKKYCYYVKDRGLRYAIQRGWVVAVRMHAGLCVWLDEESGYRFHSTIACAKLLRDENSETFFNENKHRTRIRVSDAEFTLSELPWCELPVGLELLPAPSFRRAQYKSHATPGLDYDECDEGENEAAADWEEQ